MKHKQERALPFSYVLPIFNDIVPSVFADPNNPRARKKRWRRYAEAQGAEGSGGRGRVACA